MKIFSTSLLYLLCLGISVAFQMKELSAQNLDWTYENIVTDVQESGANPDVVQDANGNLHVSYWQADEDRLKYGFRNATTGLWTHETLDVGDNFHGYKSAIALDANDKVHIAYVKRIQSVAQIRYINNVSGSWQVEIPFPSENIGKYGKDLEFPVFAQTSLDIFFQPDGNPVILFFDGRVSTLGNCGAIVNRTYLDYDLDMNMMVRLNDGTWDAAPFDNVQDSRGLGCLLDGDRFGEFCQVLTKSDNSYFAFTNSLHNHKLLLYSSPNLINWQVKTIDSTDRFFNVINENHFREGFEFPHAQMLGDSIVHMIYGVSNHYGNGDVFAPRRPLYYCKFNPNLLGTPGYEPFYRVVGGSGQFYRSYSSLATRSEDSVFISFFDLDKSELTLGASYDGGQNWQYEVVSTVQTNTSVHLLMHADSLRILYYDSEKNQMLLSSRKISGSVWRTENATQSELRGNLVSSKVVRAGNVDTKHVAFLEEISGTLYYATSTGSTWTFENILSDASGLADFHMDLDANDSPLLVYANDATEQLRIAWRQGGWNTRLIASFAKARNISFQLKDGAYHVAYFDLNTGHLHYLNASTLTGPWNLTVVDSSSNIVGRGLDMAIENNGTIHLSYQDVINPKVRHAFLNPGASWQVEDITMAFNFNPNFTSMGINSQNLPAIAFRDASTNTIQLAENDGTGWNITEVDGQGGNLIGSPMELLIDDKDKPWILYNISDIRDEMGLVRRDEFGNWNQVSINNNSVEIARSFDFHLVEEDFYIIGKQNKLNDNGVGLLFAEKGLKTDVEALIEETNLNIHPNPVKDLLKVSFFNPQAQKISFDLYNLNGQLIQPLQKMSSVPIGQQELSIQIPPLSPGIYILFMKGENYQIPQKLLVMP